MSENVINIPGDAASNHARYLNLARTILPMIAGLREAIWTSSLRNPGLPGGLQDPFAPEPQTRTAISIGPRSNAQGDGVAVGPRTAAESGMLVIDLQWLRDLVKVDDAYKKGRA